MKNDPPNEGGKARPKKVVKAVLGWLALRALWALLRRLFEHFL
ncbi:hypothetical protein ABT083_34195 [Streptomyces goshikiensis]